MARTSISTIRRARAKWDQVLLRTIETQGLMLLAEILESKLSHSQSIPRAVVPKQAFNALVSPHTWKPLAATSLKALRKSAEALATSAEHFNDICKRLVHGPKRLDALADGAQALAETTAHSGGFVLGLQLPQFDLQLVAAERSKETITVHAAPLFAARVLIEWVEQITDRSRLHPNLTSTDVRILKLLQSTAQRFAVGLERGWTTRQWLRAWLVFWRHPAMAQHRVPAQFQAIEQLQRLLEQFRRR